MESPKAHHDTLFTFLNDIDAGKCPHHSNNAGDKPKTRKPGTTAAATATATALAAAAEQATQLVLHFLDDLIQVRWALVIATTPGILIVTASRLVPGHALLR